MFLKNIMSVFGSKVGVVLTTLLVSIILARGLGVADRGVLASILIFPQLMIALLEGGMRQAATYYISSDRFPSNLVLGAILQYWVISAFIGYVLCAILIGYYVSYSHIYTILIASAILPFDILCAFLRGYFLGKENFSKYNLILITPKFITLVCLSILYYLGFITIFVVLIIILISSIINVIQIFYFILRKEGISPCFDCKVLKVMFKKGIVYALSLFFIVANYKVDILLLSQLSTSVQTGLYTVVTQVGESLWQLPGAVVVVLMSRSANRKEITNFHETVLHTSRLTFWVTSICAIFVGILSPYVIPLAFGREYSDASNILLYLLPGLVFMVYFKIINADYAGNGKPHVAFYVMFPATILNIILNYLLIPGLGAVGAALSSSVSYLLASILIIFIYYREKKFNLNNLFISNLATDETRNL